MSSIIEHVETFIQRLHDCDYILSETASKSLWSPDSTRKNARNLGEFLADSISKYEVHRNNEQERFNFASGCDVWINRAFACGFVKEGEGLARKLKECQEKVTQLESDLQKISEDYMNLQRLQEMTQFAKYVQFPEENKSDDENAHPP